jgi:hypothetical protein
MFGSIKGLIPEPRQADQPRHYIGRHRHAEAPAPPRPRSEEPPVEPDGDGPTRELASASTAPQAAEADSASEPGR